MMTSVAGRLLKFRGTLLGMTVLCLSAPLWAIQAGTGVVSSDNVEAAQPMTAPFRGFVENRGQWSTNTRFAADFDGLVVRAERGAFVLQRFDATDGQARLGVVRLAFEGAAGASPLGVDPAPGENHFFYGNDPASWRTHVPAYSEIRYPVADGVEVGLSRRAGRLQYDVHFAPGAAESGFVVRCEGIEGLAIEPDGGLRMETARGPIVQSAPIARQLTAAGQSKPATWAFRIVDAQHFGLRIPDREAGASVVVDSGLTWSTFLGGSAGDHPNRIRVLPSGQLLIAGRSSSPDFPTTPGVLAPANAGSSDVVLTCLEPSGSALVFSTYLGGTGVDAPGGLAVAEDGSIALAGYTNSLDFPVMPDAFDTSFNGGDYDAFASVLTADGSKLTFSTLIGGECNEVFRGVAFDNRGIVVAAGNTCSPTFPATPAAFDSSYSSSADAIVCWFDPSQSGSPQLSCSTFLGSAGSDQVLDLTMGLDEQPLIVGTSTSSEFPTTPGAYDESPGGNFITRLAADGSTIVASTHFKGGTPRQVVLDGTTVLIAGNPGFELPVSPDAYDPTWNGFSDAFVARLDDSLTQVLAATYLGGSRNDSPGGLAVEPSGAIVVVGSTQSDDYPTTLGAYDTVKGAPFNSMTSMVSCLSPDLSELRYSSFLGPTGQQSSWANDVVALDDADVVVIGEGALLGFPTTPGAFDETFNGGTLGTGDGYVTRMLLEPQTWSLLGNALPGSNGTPLLTGEGDLVGGQPLTLSLTSAKSATATTLVVGLSLLNVPFKGGTLVPNPYLLAFGLPTNAHGSLTLGATWPSGLPSGLAVFMQFWIPDAAGPAGFAASNGLAGITP